MGVGPRRKNVQNLAVWILCYEFNLKSGVKSENGRIIYKLLLDLNL